LLLQVLPREASLVRVILKRNLEVVFFLRKSLGDVRFFGEKVYSLSVAPEPLAIWNKKLEGLESFELKKISPEDMYLAVPEPISRFFFEERTQTKGPFVIFSGGLSEVGGSWSLCG
jgi:hypothetical protein